MYQEKLHCEAYDAIFFLSSSITRFPVPVNALGFAYCKTWKKHALAEVLIDKKNIDWEVEVFPFNSCRVQDYKRNLNQTLPDFEEYIIEGFSL